jgi:hypothetical protein
MSVRILKQAGLWVSKSPINFVICSYMEKGKFYAFTANCGCLPVTCKRRKKKLNISSETEKLLASFSSIKL